MSKDKRPDNRTEPDRDNEQRQSKATDKDHEAAERAVREMQENCRLPNKDLYRPFNL